MEAVREVAERVATPDEPVARVVCRDLDDRAAARDDRKTEQVLDNEVYEPAEPAAETTLPNQIAEKSSTGTLMICCGFLLSLSIF